MLRMDNMKKFLKIEFDNKNSYIEEFVCCEEGQYLVSLRPFFEAAGWAVQPSKKYGTMLLTKGEESLEIKAENSVIKHNGLPLSLIIEPKIIGSRFYIPVLPILQVMGYNMEVKNNGNKILISPVEKNN